MNYIKLIVSIEVFVLRLCGFVPIPKTWPNLAAIHGPEPVHNWSSGGGKASAPKIRLPVNLN